MGTDGENNEITDVVQKKKSPVVPIIIGVVAALVIIVGVVIAVVATISANSPAKRLQKQLDLGDKYLADLDYVSAILAYKEAINIDPKDERAYVALGEIYTTLVNTCMEKGDYSGAEKYINDGLDILGKGRAEIPDSLSILQKYEAMEDLKDQLNNVFETVPGEEGEGGEGEPEEEIQLIIEEGVYDYRIVEGVIGKSKEEATAWLHQYFGSNNVYEEGGSVVIEPGTNYMIETEGYRFTTNKIDVAFQGSGAFQVSFIKTGNGIEMDYEACSNYFTATLGTPTQQQSNPGAFASVYSNSWDKIYKDIDLSVVEVLAPDIEDASYAAILFVDTKYIEN